jgi:hypothetical protein
MPSISGQKILSPEIIVFPMQATRPAIVEKSGGGKSYSRQSLINYSGAAPSAPVASASPA